MPQVKKSDDLQLSSGFFVFMTIAFHDGNKQMAWRDDLASAAFGKITAVYGQIFFARRMLELCTF
jgi:hypothetical protein